MLRYTILVLALFGVSCVLSRHAAKVVPTRDEQCKAKNYYTGACREWPSYHSCEVLHCAIPDGKDGFKPVEVGPAVNGTHCLYDGICINQGCVEATRPPSDDPFEDENAPICTTNDNIEGCDEKDPSCSE